MPRVLVSTKNSGAASASAVFSVATSQRVNSRHACTVCEPVGSSSRTMIFGFMGKPFFVREGREGARRKPKARHRFWVFLVFPFAFLRVLRG